MLKKGDLVVHAKDPDTYGVGTIVEDRGRMAGVHMFRVAWPMPNSMAQTLSMPEDSLRRADEKAQQ